MLLFDPLTELIRLGIRFFYKISHVDLESVIRPTHDRRVVNSRLIDAVQQRIVREEVRAAARGYTSKQQIVPSSSSLQLAARSDFEL